MEPDGDDGHDCCAHPEMMNAQPLRTRLYLTLDPGFAVPLGDTGHLLSLDLGLASAINGKNGGFVTLSAADAIR